VLGETISEEQRDDNLIHRANLDGEWGRNRPLTPPPPDPIRTRPSPAQTACWNDIEIPYTAADVTRNEDRVARVRAEIVEIRAAVEAMRLQGETFLDEFADFLDREALQLERFNEADGPVELDPRDDTREQSGYAPTSARRALLIARAFTSSHPTGAGRG
jgi:hypothetical protein